MRDLLQKVSDGSMVARENCDHFGGRGGQICVSFMNARKSTFNSQQFCGATLKFSRHTSCSEEKNTAVLYEAICVISLELDFKKKRGGGEDLTCTSALLTTTIRWQFLVKNNTYFQHLGGVTWRTTCSQSFCMMQRKGTSQDFFFPCLSVVCFCSPC